MATRNTQTEAQELVDFMQSKRPAATFRITEIVTEQGEGEWYQKFSTFHIEERGTCSKCGSVIWHIDYGNTDIAHTTCEIKSENDLREASQIRQVEQVANARLHAEMDVWEEA